jgi:hypothetical protein
VVVRFKESDSEADLQKEVKTNLQDVQQELEQLPLSGQQTGSKLTPQQLQQVGCDAMRFVTAGVHLAE